MGHNLLREVGISILGAGTIGFSVYRLKLPLLLGYMAAGLMLGPHLGFGIITSPETISILSEIGLILLMYILGMEINIKNLMKAGKAVIINGVTQFLGCAILGLVFFHFLGFSFFEHRIELIYLAIATSLSSTLIVVKLLSDRMELHTLTSRLSVGILVIQDIWAIAFLATQPNLADFKILVLLISFGKAGLLIAVTGLLAKFILPWIFERVGKQVELTLVIAMGWCFLICGFAGILGLSLEMGALVAGVSIASFPYHMQIATKISSLRDFFVTLFFVALGLQIPMPNMEILFLAIGIIVFIIGSRFLTIFPVLYLMKHGNRGSLIPSVNLAQVSEFALVILSLGVSYKHVPQYFLSSFIIALVFTALLSSLLIPKAHQLYRILNPILEKFGIKDQVGLSDDKTAVQIETHDNIIFLGFYREASSLLWELEAQRSANVLKNIQVVDLNPETIAKLSAKGVHIHYGDIGDSDIFHHVNLHHAKIVISTIPDSVLQGTSNRKLLQTIKQHAPNAKCIVTAESLSEAVYLYKNGADYVYLPRIITAWHLMDVIQKMEVGNSQQIEESLKYLEKRIETIK